MVIRIEGTWFLPSDVELDRPSVNGPVAPACRLRQAILSSSCETCAPTLLYSADRNFAWVECQLGKVFHPCRRFRVRRGEPGPLALFSRRLAGPEKSSRTRRNRHPGHPGPTAACG